MSDAPPLITNEDAVIESSFFWFAPGPNLLRACPLQRLGFGCAPSRCSARAACDAEGVGPS